MKKKFIILIHATYWLLYTSLLLLLLSIITGGPAWHNRFLFTLLPFFIYLPAACGFYSFYSFLFNRYLAQKKILQLVLAGILTALLSGITGMCILGFVWPRHLPNQEQFSAVTALTVIMAVNALLNGIIALAIHAFITWYTDIRWKEELARKSAETELALVKSQLNPHFLFNTLNNIDVLIEKDPVVASQYFKKLSAILRFVLYETHTEQIKLADELAYIEKYIDLQRLRSSHPDYVHYNITGNPDHIQVAPMLFIPFIENAFKYAVNKKDDKAICVKFDIRDNTVNFQCSNHYHTSVIQANNKEGGLGNSLIYKRLQLLYPDSHQLGIDTRQEKYTVHLSISLPCV